MSARTRVHGGQQLEARRELGLAGCAGDDDATGFQRFAQRFQRHPWEFGQFIEEQHTFVSERDLARPRW